MKMHMAFASSLRRFVQHSARGSQLKHRSVLASPCRSFGNAAGHFLEQNTAPELIRKTVPRLGYRSYVMPVVATTAACMSLICWMDAWSLQRLRAIASDFMKAGSERMDVLLQADKIEAEESVPPVAVQESSPLYFRREAFYMKFQSAAGPEGMGRLIIAPDGPKPLTVNDTVEYLNDLDDLAHTQLQMPGSGNLVCIFDLSASAWYPSMFTLPAILRTISKHELSEAFKQRTQSFAIVCKQGGWLDSVVKAVIKFKSAESIPIFAPTVADADRLLAERFFPQDPVR